MGGLNLEITIDKQDTIDLINKLHDCMSDQQFKQAMYGVFKRTGGHVKKVLREDLPKEYYVKAGAINSAVQSPQLSMGGGSVGCVIPIKDHRGSIGGRYSASGGAHGWASLHKKYRVKGRIVKGGQSTLPAKWHSGQAPFRNLSAKSLNGVTFARAGKARFPIKKIVGIAIPQMPTNRSEQDVQKDIREYLEAQIEKRFMQLMRAGR